MKHVFRASDPIEQRCAHRKSLSSNFCLQGQAEIDRKPGHYVRLPALSAPGGDSGNGHLTSRVKWSHCDCVTLTWDSHSNLLVRRFYIKQPLHRTLNQVSKQEYQWIHYCLPREHRRCFKTSFMNIKMASIAPTICRSMTQLGFL